VINPEAQTCPRGRARIYSTSLVAAAELRAEGSPQPTSFSTRRFATLGQSTWPPESCAGDNCIRMVNVQGGANRRAEKTWAV